MEQFEKDATLLVTANVTSFDGKVKTHVAEVKTKAAQAYFKDALAMGTSLPQSVNTLSLEDRKTARGIIDLGFDFTFTHDKGNAILTILDSEGTAKMTFKGSNKQEALKKAKESLFNLPSINPIVRSMEAEGQRVFEALTVLGYEYDFTVKGTKKHANVYKRSESGERREVGHTTASTYKDLHRGLMASIFDRSNEPSGFKAFDELSKSVKENFPLYQEGNKARGTALRKSLDSFSKHTVEMKRRTMERYDAKTFNGEYGTEAYKEGLKVKKEENKLLKEAKVKEKESNA